MVEIKFIIIFKIDKLKLRIDISIFKIDKLTFKIDISIFKIEISIFKINVNIEILYQYQKSIYRYIKLIC